MYTWLIIDNFFTSSAPTKSVRYYSHAVLLSTSVHIICISIIDLSYTLSFYT